MRKKIVFLLVIIGAVTIIQGAVMSVMQDRITSMAEQSNDANTITTQINGIKNAHNEWLQNLTLALYTGSEFTGSLNPETCAFGSWLKEMRVAQKDDAEFQALLDQMSPAHRLVHETAAQIVAELEAGNHDAAVGAFAGAILPNIKLTHEGLDALFAHAEAVMADMARASDELRTISLVVSIATMVLSLVCVLVITLVLESFILPPLRVLTAAARDLSRGKIDLTLRIKNHDEFRVLADAFADMSSGIREQAQVLESISAGDYTASLPVRSEEDVMNLAINRMVARNNTMIREIKESSEQVAAGASQIAYGAQALASGATEQSATLSEFVRVIERLQRKAQENTRLAEDTASGVQNAGRLMGESNDYMRRMTEAMRRIDASSQNIFKVIGAIEDIAFQTNILALNASVEAAHAGVNGRGFAVVADEVRSLALQSAAAAKESAALIEESISNAKIGTEIVGKTNASITKAGEISQSNALSIEKMRGAFHEQTEAITQITGGMNEISSVVQANSATAQESAASAQEMNSQSAILMEIVGRFKLREDAGRALPARTRGKAAK